MNKTDCIIRLETPADYRINEEMIRESFWNVYRPGALEHYVMHTFRSCPDVVQELNFVMEKDGEIIGQNVFVRAAIHCDDGREVPVLAMGPICIRQDLKRQGYGEYLLNYTLDKAAEMGFGAVCFEGNYLFYRHGGLKHGTDFGLHYEDTPDEEAGFFLCRELIPGYLDGVTGTYGPPQCYLVDEEEAAEFDRSFPPKERLHLPGQLV